MLLIGHFGDLLEGRDRGERERWVKREGLLLSICFGVLVGDEKGAFLEGCEWGKQEA
jgi:hypothetical protein